MKRAHLLDGHGPILLLRTMWILVCPATTKNKLVSVNMGETLVTYDSRGKTAENSRLSLSTNHRDDYTSLGDYQILTNH